MPSDSILLFLTVVLLFMAFAGLLATVSRLRRKRQQDRKYISSLSDEVRQLSARIDALERRRSGA